MPTQPQFTAHQDMVARCIPTTGKPIVLTIAGSDCSGGAGIEADLKTFTAHRVYGMAVVTCVVAENPGKVVSIHPIPSKIVNQQLDCCLKDMPPVVIKTGMLYSKAIIQTISLQLAARSSRLAALIVDPVMVATSGKRLLEIDAIRTLKKLIGDHADLVTPNLPEAEILSAIKIKTQIQMEKAARKIACDFECAVLLKGGHLKDRRWAKDFFWDGENGFWLRSPRIRGIKTHGTGCTYSAAIAANLALGYSLPISIRRAKHFVTQAIRKTHCFGPWMALNTMISAKH